VKAKDVIMLDMTIEEAAKLVISAGLVAPEYPKPVAISSRRQPARSNLTAASRENR
jgi:uncharacterized membrane protein